MKAEEKTVICLKLANKDLKYLSQFQLLRKRLIENKKQLSSIILQWHLSGDISANNNHVQPIIAQSTITM